MVYFTISSGSSIVSRDDNDTNLYKVPYISLLSHISTEGISFLRAFSGVSIEVVIFDMTGSLHGIDPLIDANNCVRLVEEGAPCKYKNNMLKLLSYAGVLKISFISSAVGVFTFLLCISSIISENLSANVVSVLFTSLVISMS